MRSAQICKKCTIFASLRPITQEGKKETRQMTPFFSSTFWALTSCDIHFCILKMSKFVFMGTYANLMNTASITVTGKRVIFGDGQSLQIPCTILFKGKEKYIEVLKNSWTCTLYNCLYAWNIVSKVWRISVLSLKYMFKFILSLEMF